MTEMNTPETKKLFTIAQAANACSVSRSTLLRMEEEGLLKPARHNDGRYRYYDVQNIMEAMQIYSMHRMGLTRSQIRPLIDTPEEIMRQPASEYVREFIQDINRLQVMKHDTPEQENDEASLVSSPVIGIAVAFVTAGVVIRTYLNVWVWNLLLKFSFSFPQAI